MEDHPLIMEALLAYAGGNLARTHDICVKLIQDQVGGTLPIDLLHKCRVEHHQAIQSRNSSHDFWKFKAIGQTALNTLLLSPQFEHPRLERHGSSSFSQADDDGIIAEIFRRIGHGNKIFFEFGRGGDTGNSVSLFTQGWTGVWLDGDDGNTARIRADFAKDIERGTVKVGTELVTAENINELTAKYELPEMIDLVSIDIDGNDYYVVEAMNLKARVLVVEYNARFQPPARVVQKYHKDFYWKHGGPFVGASLQSFTDLCNKKGMTLVGTSISGTNAYFVSSELVGDKVPMPATADHLWNPPRYNLIFSGAWYSGHQTDFTLAEIERP